MSDISQGKTMKLVIEMPEEQIWAFGEFCKRLLWDDYKNRTVDEKELYDAMAVGERIWNTIGNR